jgi:hypothetical protein
MNWIRPRLTYANVMVTLLAFVVLGGSAIAASRLSKNSVGPKQIRKNAVRSGEVKNDRLTGDDVKEATLKLPASAQVTGRSGVNDQCDPVVTTFTNCGTVTLNLPDASRVLLVAAAGQFTSTTTTQNSGDCRLESDGAAVPGTTIHPGATVNTANSTATNGFAVTGVTGVLGKGNHTFRLTCTQTAGDVLVGGTTISAIALAAN